MVLLVGCQARPHPPALHQNLSVFRDAREGFRFAPPQGWSQQGRASASHDDPAREYLLVKYQRTSETKMAFLEVCVKDLPPAADLSAYLGERQPTKNWQRGPQPETVEVDHLPALREAFAGAYDKDRYVKEVVAVRRGERVYFFTGTFAASDTQARDQIRQAVTSVVWEGQPKT
jgi:predicted Zn-dependent protease